MSDPRNVDHRMQVDHRRLEMEHRMGAPTPWGWIAAAVLVIVVVALVFTSRQATRTASNDPSAATGMAPNTAPPAIPVPPAVETPSTSGQSGVRHQ
jgi:hypothetical protein